MSLVTTPLRYPGGKSSLMNFLRLLLQTNEIRNGHYVEPYCGGAGAAISLLKAEAVSHIHINDADPAVFSFWKAVLQQPRAVCNFIESVPLTVEEWRNQQAIYRASTQNILSRACAFLYLNRVNRSGILNGGLIGGLAQQGEWLMDARFNRADLSYKVKRIAEYKDSITIANDDAIEFLKKNNKKWPQNTLIYLDPPYYNKGQCLYRNHYAPADHASIAGYLRRLTKRRWIASYDATPEIKKLYKGLHQQTYSLAYTARERSVGKEIIIYGSGVLRPSAPDPMKIDRRLLLQSTHPRQT